MEQKRWKKKEFLRKNLKYLEREPPFKELPYVSQTSSMKNSKELIGEREPLSEEMKWVTKGVLRRNKKCVVRFFLSKAWEMVSKALLLKRK